MTNAELVALLREAAEHMKAVAKDRGPCPDCVSCDRGIDITTRIDAALAEHEAEERVEWEEGTDYEKKPWYEAWIGHIGLHIRRWPWRSHKEPEVFYWHVWSPLDEDGQAATLDEAKKAAIAAARGVR